MINLKGVGVALVTPFDETGNVDFIALANLLEHTINGGVDFLVVFGTTAEPPTLTDSEKAEIFSFIKEKNSGRVPLVLGMGGNNTQGIIDQITNCDFDGISAILSVTPYYNKPTQEGLYSHYIAVAEASPVPVILYNVPSRTGVNMSAKTVLRLAAASKNIVAVKEASGSLSQAAYIIKDAPENFFVLSGDDNLTLPMMALGADGVISVVANVFPAEFTEMVRATADENLVIARSKYYKLLSITDMLFEQGNPAGVKCALSIKGIAPKYVRLPLVCADDDLEKRMIEYIDNYKL